MDLKSTPRFRKGQVVLLCNGRKFLVLEGGFSPLRAQPWYRGGNVVERTSKKVVIDNPLTMVLESEIMALV